MKLSRFNVIQVTRDLFFSCSILFSPVRSLCAGVRLWSSPGNTLLCSMWERSPARTRYRAFLLWGVRSHSAMPDCLAALPCETTCRSASRWETVDRGRARHHPTGYSCRQHSCSSDVGSELLLYSVVVLSFGWFHSIGRYLQERFDNSVASIFNFLISLYPPLTKMQ